MASAPPKPRRIILDLFGDYLRFCPDAEVRLGHLTTLLGAFGIAPAAVRVTMSRLRRDGWFTSRRDGRETIYRLTPTMLKVLEEGRQRIFVRQQAEWSGVWTMVVYQMSEEERQDREKLRKDLAWHGFGFLGSSTWLAPGDRREDARKLSADLPSSQVDVLRCLTDDLGHDRALVARCWDLPVLAAEYDEFLRSYRPLVDKVDSLRGPDALVARTLLISAYRHFPYRGPSLPAELAPARWPVDEARSLFTHLHTALGPASRVYVSAVVGLPVGDVETVVG